MSQLHAVKLAALAIGASFLASCASTQLNYNTLDLASTVGDIQTKQVLFNLALLNGNKAAIPTHVDLTTGTASTTNSITPTISTPFNTGITAVNTLAKTASGSPSTVTTTQTTAADAATSANIQLQDSWTQNWAYDPVIAGDELRRLRALYLYGLGLFSDKELLREYPLIEKAQTISYAGGDAGNSKTYSIANDPIYCPNIGLTTRSNQVEDVNRGVNMANTGAQCGSVAVQIQIPDEHFLHEPSCIICIRHGEVYSRYSRLRVNSRLRYLNGGWLLIDPVEVPEDAVLLANYSKHNLYVRKDDLIKLSEFTLFVLTATEQSSASPASSSGAGGGGGKKSGVATLFSTGNPTVQQFIRPSARE